MKEIKKALKKFRTCNSLEEMSDHELIIVTKYLIDNGDLESSKDTTRELEKRHPFTKARTLLSEANTALIQLYINLGKLEKDSHGG
jgi:hypothetical protein